MKKYITIAALLAVGTAFASAEDYTGKFAWTADTTPTLTFADAPLTLTITGMTIDTTAVDFSTADPKAVSIINPDYRGTLAPNTNIGNGGLWSISFTITNTKDEALTLESITFDAFAYNGNGTAQNADFLKREITFALTGGATTSVVHSFTNIDLDTDVYNWDTNPTLTFKNPLEIAADGSAGFTLSVSESDSVGCFIGLSGLTVSAIPEPSTFGLLAGLGALALVGARRRRK